MGRTKAVKREIRPDRWFNQARGNAAKKNICQAKVYIEQVVEDYWAKAEIQTLAINVRVV